MRMECTKRAAWTLLCIVPLIAGTDVICPKNVALLHVLVSLTPTGLERAEYINHPLAAEAREHFAPFADHPAVAFTEQLFRRMSYHPMNYLALLHSDFPEAREIRRLPDYLPADEDSRAMLTRYVGLVRDFYEASGFEAFWNAHESRVAAVLDTARANIHAPELPRMMEDFYGREAGRFIFVTSPFMQESGFHAELFEDGRLDFYYFSGARTYANELYFNYIAFHEFSHSFIQPVSTKYSDRISALSHLYQPLEDRFRRMGYPTWEHAFEEHMVTAGQLHLTRSVFGDQQAMEMLEREKMRGFQLIERLYGLFAQYSESRDEYEDLEEFYPVILHDLAAVRVEEYREPDVMGFYARIDETGVAVDRVVEGSAFDQAGIEAGDLLVSIGGEPIGTEENFRAAKGRWWSAAREGDAIDVTVVRSDTSLTFSIAVPFATRYRYVERES
jgi:hypothetical protein